MRHLFITLSLFTAFVGLALPTVSSAQTCNSTIKLGFGDTTKPSDTRFASQMCRGRRATRESLVLRSFVPGSGDRIFNNSLTPCERIRSARLFCNGALISNAMLRPGCPNGRVAFDFCAANGGGAAALDRACPSRRLTVEVTRSNGSTFCYSPPCANCTFRNGQLTPNRTR